MRRRGPFYLAPEAYEEFLRSLVDVDPDAEREFDDAVDWSMVKILAGEFYDVWPISIEEDARSREMEELEAA